MNTCIHCDEPVYAIDTEYDEGYCKAHFAAQQRSSEPIEYVRYVHEEDD